MLSLSQYIVFYEVRQRCTELCCILALTKGPLPPVLSLCIVFQVLSKTTINISTASDTIITSAISPPLLPLSRSLLSARPSDWDVQLLNVVYTRDDVMGRGDFWVKTKGLNVFVCCFSTENNHIKLPFKEAGS